MNFISRYLRISLLLPIFLFFHITGSAAAPGATTTPSPPLEKVSLQLSWKHQFQFAGFYAAIEQGYFAEQGLEVELREYQNEIDHVDEVLRGRADFGILSDNLLYNRIEGKNVVLLANYFRVFPLVILSRPGLKSLEDLKGKRLMISDKDRNSIITRAAFHQAGLIPGKNIELFSHTYNADPFINGTVDAMSAFLSNEPFLLDQQSVPYEVIELTKVLPGIGGANLFTNEQQAEKNPERTRAFVKAANKGWQYAIDHPEEIVDLILEKYSSRKSREALLYEAEETRKLIMPGLYPIGAIFKDRIRAVTQALMAVGKDDEALRLQGLIIGDESQNMFAGQEFWTQTGKTTVALTLTEKAFLQSHPVITLGAESSWEPYVIVKKDGNITGFDAEILSKINALTGANFQLKAGAWREMQKAAQERRIDGLSTGGIHEERKTYLNFSDSYISLKKILLVAKGNPRNIQSRADLKGKRIGIHRGNFSDEKLALSFPDAEIVSMDTLEEVLRAVINGKVDVVFGNDAVLFIAQKQGILHLEKSLDLHTPLDLVFAVRNDWPEAITILNKGLAAIPKYERFLIQKKWFAAEKVRADNSPASLLLNEDEKVWLGAHPVIRVRAGDFPPYLIRDNGPKGISIDILDRIAEMAGFQIEYQYATMSWPEALENIRKHEKIDLLPTAKRTPERETYMLFSRDYLKLPWVIFTRQDEQTVFSIEDLFGKTVAIEKGYVMQKRLAKEFPQIKLLLFPNTAEALAAVSDNRADAYVGTLTVAQYQITNLGLNNLKVAAPTELGLHTQAFAIRDDWPQLVSILNKGLAAITTEERNKINRKYFTVKVEQGVNLLQFFWYFLGLTLFLLFILFWNYRLQREVKIRRRTERALSKSEELFRTIFENVPALIDSFDENGKCTLWNNACEKTFGWTRDEINTAENPMSLFYPDPAVCDRVVKSRQESVGSEFIKWHPRNKNGDVLTTRWNNFRISDGTVIGFGIDETLLEKQTTELRKLSRAVEQSHSTIVITDLDGNIEFVNPAFRHSTGYTQEEAIGQNPRILKSGQQDASVYKDLWNTLTKGGVWQGELHNKRKDGSCYWEFASISPVKDAEGKTTHYLAVKEDISERKIAEQQLIEAQQQAEDANQAKSDFLANMSHEIRTPMNAIIGMSHLALQTNLSHKQQDYVNKIDFAANSLLRIINDILDFSKIEAGKLEMEAIPFRLTGVLDNLASLIAVIAKDQKLAFNITVASDVPPCLVGDPFRLGQILLNLSNNALKFTEKGEISVQVACIDKDVNRDNDQVQLQFSVIDTGIGMTEAQLEGLFQSFSQADSSTTRKYGGTGLGLSISKQLVEMMGGKISAESQYGRGSTFFFTLQYDIADIACLTEPVQTTGSNGLAGIRGAKILLVEDNLINQQVARELLEMKQMVVTIANNGQKAVDLVKSHSFDAVLMDVQMPVMDGHTATGEIRKDSALADLPIIAMTANVMAADCQRCFDAGMNDHIAKPIDPDKMFQTLVRWIPAREEIIESETVEQRSQVENDLPANLPGIDMALGLHRTAGSSKLLAKLMGQFHKDHGLDVQLIRESLKAGEMEKAQRIAHTVKGVAGTIGAVDLQQAAIAVDAALNEGNEEEILALLLDLDRELLGVMRGLESIRAVPVVDPEQKTNSELDSKAVSSLLNTIYDLAHEFDPGAEEKAAMLAQLLAGSPHHDDALRLLNQIEETEFDEACETIQLMLAALSS